MRPALARVPGVGHVEVLASDTREIEVILDPAKLLAAEPDGRRRRRRAQGREPARAGRPLSRRTACSISCSRPACGSRPTEIARHAGRRQERRDARVARPRDGRRRARPIARSLIAGQGGNADGDQRLAADRRQHPRRAQAASRTRCSNLADALPAGLQLDEDVRPRGVRRDGDRQRPRRDPDRRRARRARAARLPARLAADARRRHARCRSRSSRRSSSCGSSAGRST